MRQLAPINLLDNFLGEVRRRAWSVCYAMTNWLREMMMNFGDNERGDKEDMFRWLEDEQPT